MRFFRCATTTQNYVCKHCSGLGCCLNSTGKLIFAFAFKVSHHYINFFNFQLWSETPTATYISFSCIEGGYAYNGLLVAIRPLFLDWVYHIFLFLSAFLLQKFDKVWYNHNRCRHSQQKGGGELMQYIFTFLISVMAQVAGYFLCKWLDRDKHDN